MRPVEYWLRLRKDWDNEHVSFYHDNVLVCSIMIMWFKLDNIKLQCFMCIYIYTYIHVLKLE